MTCLKPLGQLCQKLNGYKVRDKKRQGITLNTHLPINLDIRYMYVTLYCALPKSYLFSSGKKENVFMHFHFQLTCVYCMQAPPLSFVSNLSSEITDSVHDM